MFSKLQVPKRITSVPLGAGFKLRGDVCRGEESVARGHPVVPLRLSVPDAISSTNPRVIDDARARKLSSDLKRCTYYETCATYGLNVERVFQDGKYSLL